MTDFYGAVGDDTSPPVPDASQMAYVNKLEALLREIAGNIDACCCLENEQLDRMEELLGVKVYTSYVQRGEDTRKGQRDE